ncbi:lysylphosphatidylglycerol synthase domain-containing protein [Cyanobacterium sp. uoEpiScrs1]|uniref:lysylphosphatidylglycerol synthase domain-containing protein n=1 Tax=Cyanobacterium sp. uoEpiScrs1 TaxID=2976343 RepID=UPI00226ADB7A|nr:lysylphosphatidylglycerol synthase domain-containing protein [Cyanobacterium sp. uoEpiScrs1]
MFNSFLRLLIPCSSLAIFILSLWTIHKNFHHYNAQNIWNILSTIPLSNIIKAIALTGLNYTIMTGYDCLAVNYIRHTLSFYKKALASIICSGISNSVGFTLVSSCIIRYRLYSNWGLSLTSITQISTFCNLTFILGLFIVGAIVFITNPLENTNILNFPFVSVQLLGVIFLFLILGYLLVTIFSKKQVKIGQWTLPHLSVKLILGQLIVSTLDWLLAASVFYSVFSSSVYLSYSTFLEIYILAQIVGLTSNIPGGLGVFEAIILVFLSPYISTENILLFLFIYRLIYYFIPLIISVVLLGAYELKHIILQSNSMSLKKFF